MATEISERFDATPTVPHEPDLHAETIAEESTPGTLGSKLLRPHTIISFVIALAIMGGVRLIAPPRD